MTNVEERDDLVTEELEGNDEDNALDTEESETDAETEQVEDDTVDDGEDERDSGARDRAKAQIDRLKEQNRKLKEQLEKGGQKGDEGQVASSDLLYRTYLGQQGYTNRDVQDAAIERAKKLGTTVDQLLTDPDEKEFLDLKAKRLQTAGAASRPTGKGGASKRDAKWYADRNIMPDDPALVAQVWEILAQRDR